MVHRLEEVIQAAVVAVDFTPFTRTDKESVETYRSFIGNDLDVGRVNRHHALVTVTDFRNPAS